LLLVAIKEGKTFGFAWLHFNNPGNAATLPLPSVWGIVWVLI